MLLGAATSFILLFALVFQNWKRSQVSEVKELIPNCLLTSNPIVFIPGKRSLFYFLGYWNQIPHWLASHGYEVYNFPLPWKNSQKRIEVLRNFLVFKSESEEKFHLFVDPSAYQEMAALLEERNFECLSSVTLVGSEPHAHKSLRPRFSIPIEEVQLPESKKPSPWFWFFHQLWTLQRTSLQQLGWKLNREQGLVLLQRAQFLAERDLIQGQRSPTLES